jgi:hypothetical protein
MKPEARKVRRFAVQLPSTLVHDGQEHSGTVLNLSIQGCAMTTEHVPPVSTYLSLQIDPSDGTAPIVVELAGVRWVAGYRGGVEFIRISPEMLVRLRAFVGLLEETP